MTMPHQSYPYLEVQLDQICRNARVMAELCRGHGIQIAGVVKFSDGSAEIAQAYHAGGCAQIAASRTIQLEEVKTALPQATTLLLRLPMLSEIEETVRWCDISLNSSIQTLAALEKEAQRQAKTHQVILMLDVGDLREGVPQPDDLCCLARAVETHMPHLKLLGVGATFTCYGSILPDNNNLGALVQAAEQVERTIGRKLDIISGGSSTSLIPLLGGEVPERINHLRLGGSIANPRAIRLNRGVSIPGLCEDACLFHAQLIEVNRKPTRPYGVSSINWKGNAVEFADQGVRRRGIAAMGAADVGDLFQLFPMDERIRVCGGSSDHLVLDLENCLGAYEVGDEVIFRSFYGPLLYAFSTRHVAIHYVGKAVCSNAD